MNTGQAYEKALGPYTLKITCFGAGQGHADKDRYEITMLFDRQNERRKMKRNQHTVTNVMEHVATKLQEQGMECTKPHVFRAPDVDIVSIVCSVDKHTDSGIEALYEMVCAEAQATLKSDKNARPHLYKSNAIKAQALMNVLRKHGVEPDKIAAIVADLQKELKNL